MRTSIRTAVVAAAVPAAVLACVVGGQLDRAPTEGRYRPVLPPTALGSPCDPLPEGVRLEVPVQLRADRPLVSGAGPVRRLDLHYDLLDAETVRRSVTASLAAAGFTASSAPDGADPGVRSWFRRPGYGLVGVGVEPFDVPADAIVRGRLTFDLPVDSLRVSTSLACLDVVRTKRYPDYAGGVG